MLLFFLVGLYFLNLSHSALFWTPVRLMHLQKAAFPPLWFCLEVHELQKSQMLQLAPLPSQLWALGCLGGTLQHLSPLPALPCCSTVQSTKQVVNLT